jgi:hypothetical protein
VEPSDLGPLGKFVASHPRQLGLVVVPRLSEEPNVGGVGEVRVHGLEEVGGDAPQRLCLVQLGSCAGTIAIGGYQDDPFPKNGEAAYVGQQEALQAEIFAGGCLIRAVIPKESEKNRAIVEVALKERSNPVVLCLCVDPGSDPTKDDRCVVGLLLQRPQPFDHIPDRHDVACDLLLQVRFHDVTEALRSERDHFLRSDPNVGLARNTAEEGNDQ